MKVIGLIMMFVKRLYGDYHSKILFCKEISTKGAVSKHPKKIKEKRTKAVANVLFLWYNILNKQQYTNEDIIAQ